MDIRPDGRRFQIGVYPWKRRVDHSLLASLVLAMSLRFNVRSRDLRMPTAEALPEPVFPATASAKGAQFNGRSFPATAWAEGPQLNAAPSLHLAGQSAAGVHARLHEDGWHDGLRVPMRGTTGQPSRRRSPPLYRSW